jgi:hypothetical protein
MTIQLPALDQWGDLPVLEVLEVEALESGALRLVYSPGLVDGLAAGDEIELTNAVPQGFKVLRRGGNFCIWLYFEDENRVHGPAQDRIRREVERLGGELDGATDLSLVFTIPLRVGFDAVRTFFDRVVEETHGTLWIYANVYDPKTGAPLNWWK